MPGQYMNGEEPSQDGIVFLEGISSNVHVSPFFSHLHGHMKRLNLLWLSIWQ